MERFGGFSILREGSLLSEHCLRITQIRDHMAPDRCEFYRQITRTHQKNKRYDPLLERQSLFGIAQFLVGRNASWWPESTNFLHGRGDLRVIRFFVLERGRYHDERRRNVKMLYSAFPQVQLFMVPKLFSPYPVGCFWSIGINRKSSMKSIYMSEDHFQMIMMNARHGSENKVGDLYLVVGKSLIK